MNDDVKNKLIWNELLRQHDFWGREIIRLGNEVDDHENNPEFNFIGEDGKNLVWTSFSRCYYLSILKNLIESEYQILDFMVINSSFYKDEFYETVFNDFDNHYRLFRKLNK